MMKKEKVVKEKPVKEKKPLFKKKEKAGDSKVPKQKKEKVKVNILKSGIGRKILAMAAVIILAFCIMMGVLIVRTSSFTVYFVKVNGSPKNNHLFLSIN